MESQSIWHMGFVTIGLDYIKDFRAREKDHQERLVRGRRKQKVQSQKLMCWGMLEGREIPNKDISPTSYVSYRMEEISVPTTLLKSLKAKIRLYLCIVS